MEAFINIRVNSLTFLLILYLIVTSDLPHGAYCTNQIPMAYSSANTASMHAIEASDVNSTNFIYNFGGLSSGSLPPKEHDSVKSTFTSPNDGRPLVASPLSSTLPNLTKRNVKDASKPGPLPSYNIDGETFSASEDSIFRTRSITRMRQGKDEITKVQVHPPTSLSSFPNSNFSSPSQKSEGNSFPVAYLIGVLHGFESSPMTKSQGDSGGAAFPGEIVVKSAATGSNHFRSRLGTNDIIHRGGRRLRRSHTNTNDDHLDASIPLQNFGNGDGNVGGGTEATTSNNRSESNENIILDMIIESVSPSSSLPQATALISEGTTSIPTSPREASSSPLEAGEVGNESEDGGNVANEVFNTTSTTPEPGTTPLRGKCNETSQCSGEFVECRIGICKCQLGYLPRIDNGELCGEASAHHIEVPTTDPTMIGVVVGLALMSVTLCIVLRMFAKARFRENRTIFNTPNPRLMNVSLLKGKKSLLRGNSAGQRSRRGSQNSLASGQDGHAADGNGVPGTAAGSSSHHHHPHRIKPARTVSTDTTNHEGATPAASEGRSSRPSSSAHKGKYRQDSVASNV